jgi:hypothetical protein
MMSASDSLEIALGMGLSAVASGDFNSDALPDLVIAHKGSRDVSVLLARREGGFQDESRFSIGGLGPDALLVIDFNADGHLDLVSVAFDGNEVYLLPGNGDGTFQRSVLLRGGPTEALAAVEEVAQDTGQELDLETADGLTQVPADRVAEPDRMEGLPASSMMQSAASAGSQSRETWKEADFSEGTEWAGMLNSVGLELPITRPANQYQTFPDVFVIDGPGFRTDLGLLSEGDEIHGPPRDVHRCEEMGRPHSDQCLPRDNGEDLAGPGDDPAPVTAAPTAESLQNRIPVPGDDAVGSDRPNGLPNRSGPTNILMAVAMIGVLGHDLTNSLSKRRKLLSR